VGRQPGDPSASNEPAPPTQSWKRGAIRYAGAKLERMITVTTLHLLAESQQGNG
jgi:hypothetical protein